MTHSNPFILEELATNEYLFGREHYIQKALDSMNDKAKKGFLLNGIRRIGKSSMMKEIKNRLEKQGQVVYYLDLITNSLEANNALLEELQDAEDKADVILIDEYDAFSQEPYRLDFYKEFFLLLQRSKKSWGLTFTKAPERRLQSLLEEIKLNTLDKVSVTSLIEQRANNRFNQQDKEHIFNTTSGIVGLVISVCYDAFEKQIPPGQLTIEKILTFAKNDASQTHKVLQHIWLDVFDARERIILKTIQEFGSVSEEKIPFPVNPIGEMDSFEIERIKGQLQAYSFIELKTSRGSDKLIIKPLVLNEYIKATNSQELTQFLRDSSLLQIVEGKLQELCEKRRTKAYDEAANYLQDIEGDLDRISNKEHWIFQYLDAKWKIERLLLEAVSNSSLLPSSRDFDEIVSGFPETSSDGRRYSHERLWFEFSKELADDRKHEQALQAILRLSSKNPRLIKERHYWQLHQCIRKVIEQHKNDPGVFIDYVSHLFPDDAKTIIMEIFPSRPPEAIWKFFISME